MRVTRRAAIAVVSVAAALTLSACSSSSDEATTTEATAEATAEAEAEAGLTEEMSVGTIVDVASAGADFSTLVAAITAANLGETLSGEGPFTVFAPTNEAFAALPEGVLDALLLPENKDALAKILTYHVVPGHVMAGDLVGAMAMPVATVNGADITITEDGGTVSVNGAHVVSADIEASNGVIHAIDQVLLP